MAGRVPHGQGDVGLLAWVCDQLEEVVTLHELGADREAYRGGPVVARHHVGVRGQGASRLYHAFLLARAPDQSATLSSVIAHPVRV